MRILSQLSAAAFIGSVLLPHATLADTAVAIVEEISGDSAGVQTMDYVAPGRIIQLQASDTLVLSYLASCWRETITAGVITVGAKQSEIRDGKVTRTRPRCDGGKMQLTAAEANKSGALSIRSRPKGNERNSAGEAAATVYARAPIFDVKQPGRLLIERLDGRQERTTIEISSEHLLRNAFFDLASTGKSLEPGGLYRASHGGREVVFKIHRTAEAGPTPLVGRLVRFRSGS